MLRGNYRNSLCEFSTKAAQLESINILSALKPLSGQLVVVVVMVMWGGVWRYFVWPFGSIKPVQGRSENGAMPAETVLLALWPHSSSEKRRLPGSLMCPYFLFMCVVFSVWGTSPVIGPEGFYLAPQHGHVTDMSDFLFIPWPDGLLNLITNASVKSFNCHGRGEKRTGCTSLSLSLFNYKPYFC